MPRKGNIVIWFKSSQRESFLPSYHKGASYRALAEALNSRHNLFFAFDAESYKGDDVFSPVSRYIDGEITPTNEQVAADVIYNLGNIPGEEFKTVNAQITNTPAFKRFCAVKSETYSYLKEFFPKTILVSTEAEFLAGLTEIQTDLVVCKPNRGTNGTGVRIFKKRDAVIDEEIKEYLSKGALLQEFVDTRKGVLSITASYHDLRLVTIHEKIVLSHVRIPEPGSFIANSHRGAAIREVPVKDLPKEILSFYEKVHAKIQRFPRPMYSMDIGVGPNGPQLFELNGHTAFPWPHFASKNFFIENLVAHLESFL